MSKTIRTKSPQAEILKAIKSFLKFTDKKILARAQEIIDDIELPEIIIEQISEVDFESNVPSSTGNGNYSVGMCIDFDDIIAECDCPYFEDTFEDCKHIVASVMALEKILKKKTTTQLKTIVSKQVVTHFKDGGPFIFPSSYISSHLVEKYCNIKSFQSIQNKAWSAYNWRFTYKHTDKELILNPDRDISAKASYLAQDKIEFSCNCGNMDSAIPCEHGLTLMALICIKHLNAHFRHFDDLNSEKAALLESYHLTLEDPMSQYFKFAFNYEGHLKIHEVPDNLLSPNNSNSWDKIRTQLSLVSVNKNQKKVIEIEHFDEVELLLSLNHQQEPFIKIEILGTRKKKTGPGFVYKKMAIRNEPSLQMLSQFYPNTASLLQPIAYDKLEQQASSYWNGNWDNLYSKVKVNWIIKLREVIQNLTDNEEGVKIFRLLADKTYQQVWFKQGKPSVSFKLTLQNKYIELKGIFTINDEQIPMTEVRYHPWFLMEHTNTFYVVDDELIEIFKLLGTKNLYVAHDNFTKLYDEIVLPLSKKYQVEYDESLQVVNTNLESEIPQLQITMGELGSDYLIFTPQWRYGDLLFDYSPSSLIKNENRLLNVTRNSVAESVKREWLQSQHPNFANKMQDFYYLNVKDALKDEWYFNFLQAAQTNEVILLDIEKLKHFNFNSAQPTLEVKVGTGIDWFDVEIEVNYGGLVVPLSELKKAILAQQKFLTLSDGSLGMIPEEWIQKYSYLLKSAKLSGDSLQVSKFQWTMVDELYDKVSDDKVILELNRKRELLKNIDKENKFTLPKKITAELRDYQHAGFQWLCTLDSMEWGGCLADDMGLGKTLQTLSFIAHLNQNQKLTHLIICPTSLIYNWESEIQKFCKHLTYHIHYGGEREDQLTHFSDYDIIITSYGMVRSDIKEFAAFNFHYIILDESHAIKNPASQITKALSVLQCKNRLALSGTPLQNNTMDIYAQMNFLNPGMLGSIDNFKSEFATPIDKHNDKPKMELLRKLLYPFLLRRTKEQVAKDLPDKTESILWCEMEKEQRKIYNSFKEYYRKLILNKIDEEGMNKSSFYILEGLLKLRQICDSPAILNEEVKYPNESVKIEELVRELEENTGSHKALVFSQFVTMLKLVEAELIKKEIPYLYLDGQTKATNRKSLVDQFQNNADKKVMLISLKAGGVGLNLTQADYVYLIDPWWNPAVEQQAIDRTHRIGQTQKVFAYKMICKDSIEEKILMLQEKKKSLSTELISGETSFVKKLTRDDIKFLFS